MNESLCMVNFSTPLAHYVCVCVCVCVCGTNKIAFGQLERSHVLNRCCLVAGENTPPDTAAALRLLLTIIIKESLTHAMDSLLSDSPNYSEM
jgi:hypothetical protein